jgi:hypothetical protein
MTLAVCVEPQQYFFFENSAVLTPRYDLFLNSMIRVDQ